MPPFEPENDFERALKLAADDPSHVPNFYRALVSANFLVIQQGPPPSETGETTLQTGYKLQIQNIEIEGKPYIPVFSSLPRLQAMIKEEVGYLGLNALEFMKITKGSALFLNPGSDYGKEFTVEEIAGILDGSIWQPENSHVVEKETQILIGQPSNYPHQLVEALKKLFKKLEAVERAFVAHYLDPSRSEKPHTLVAIEAAGDSWSRIIGDAGMVLQSVEIPDPPVDFVQITGSGGIEDYFLNDCEPFYKKRKFGVF